MDEIKQKGVEYHNLQRKSEVMVQLQACIKQNKYDIETKNAQIDELEMSNNELRSMLKLVKNDLHHAKNAVEHYENEVNAANNTLNISNSK